MFRWSHKNAQKKNYFLRTREQQQSVHTSHTHPYISYEIREYFHWLEFFLNNKQTKYKNATLSKNRSNDFYKDNITQHDKENKR